MGLLGPKTDSKSNEEKTTGDIFYSTLPNIKNTGADADRVDKLALRLSLHAQHTMQSIIQSCRVIERSDRGHKQFQPP